MAVFVNEFKKNIKTFLIWTIGIALMLLVCVFIYPEMKGQMEGMNDIFANMGAFSDAFGMDTLNFGTFLGYYGVECGNMLGLGGGLFAAFLGVSILSKEEKDNTAEFLLTHPIKRSKVYVDKALVVVTEILLMNIIIFVGSLASILAIGEEFPIKEMVLIHSGFLLLQLEIGLITFGVSAFVTQGAIGVGIGFTALMYFLNIIKNITDDAAFLKYFTPYAYAEVSDIVKTMTLDIKLVLIGIICSAIVMVVGFFKYINKDIA